MGILKWLSSNSSSQKAVSSISSTTMQYFEYLSLDEIAAILGRPVGTVKSLVHRGIAKLREDQGLREGYGEIILEATRISVENR